MPSFSNRLPHHTGNKGYELLRTPETGSLSGIITCDNFLVCDTHYWGGRTTPCEAERAEDGSLIDDTKCPACVAKQSPRTHVYVSAYSNKRTQHFLFECTANAAKAFQDYFDTASTLRGCGFTATRPKGTKNAKVVISTTAVDLGRQRLPTAPDLIAALAVIWRLPTTGFSARPVTNGDFRDNLDYPTKQPTALPIGDVLAAMHTPTENAGFPQSATAHNHPEPRRQTA